MRNLRAFFKIKTEEKKLTNKALSDELGISISYLSNLFNNKININKDSLHIKKLCKFFKFNIEEITHIEKILNNIFNRIFIVCII